MLVRLGKFFVIVTLVATTGAHWALLQSLAWTTMLADNLRTQSVKAAMTQTFDGDHPCPLCQAIAAGKKSERKHEAIVSSQKMEFPPFGGEMILIAPSCFRPFSPVDFFADSFSEEPPTPPPRSFSV